MKIYSFIIIATMIITVSCNSSKQLKPLVEISAVQLLDEYSKNELVADEKYKDRIVEIIGDVANVAQIRGTVGVYFEDYNPSSKFSVVCLSDKPEAKFFHELKRGQSVTFVGNSKGNVGNKTIYVTDCVIKKL